MSNPPSLAVIKGMKTDSVIYTYEESLDFQSKLLGLWEQQQKVMGYTAATIALGLRNVQEFLNKSNKFIWEITVQDVDNFYLELVGKGLAYSTRRKYQSNISSFLDYLRSRHGHSIWERYRVAVPQVLDRFNRHHHRKDDSDGKVVPPNPELLERFWNGLKEQIKTSRRYAPIARDYVLYRTLELAGLRIFETVMLDVKDCRFDLGECGKLHIRFGKGSRGTGHKPRWVPMLNGLDQLLKWYIENVRPLFQVDDYGPLFVSENKERLERDTARNGLRRRQRTLGFREDEIFSPHQLRHAFATKQSESGVDLLTLKALLGHRDIATTFNYTTPSSDYLERRIRLAQEKWLNELKG